MSNLAPRNCSNCRRLHRRCDRGIPSCGHCVSKEKKCEYANNTIWQKQTPYSNTTKQSVHITYDIEEMEIVLTNTRMFHHIKNFYPMISGERLDHVFDFLRAVHLNKGCATDLTAPSDEELALVYANIAFLVYSQGIPLIARYFLNCAKTLLNKITAMNKPCSIEVATTHVYFARYYICSDDRDSSLPHLSEASVFIKSASLIMSTQYSKASIRFKLLEYYYRNAYDLLLDAATGVLYNVRGIFVSHILVAEYHWFDVGGLKLDYELQQLASQLTFDFLNNSNQFIIDVNNLQRLWDVILVEEVPPGPHRKIMNKLLIMAVRMHYSEMLNNQQADCDADEMAKWISLQSKVMAPPTTIPFIVKAAVIHMRLLEKTKPRSTEMWNIIAKLSDEMKAVTRLCNSHRASYKTWNGPLEQIRGVVRYHEENFALRNISSGFNFVNMMQNFKTSVVSKPTVNIQETLSLVKTQVEKSEKTSLYEDDPDLQQFIQEFFGANIFQLQ
jgi:hypothetical protein